VINVYVDPNESNVHPGMELTLQNFWHAEIEGEIPIASYAP